MPSEPSFASTTLAVTVFLSSPANRDDSRFLQSVWESSQAHHGHITEAQQAAVRRIMVERGWRFEPTGAVTAPAQGAEPTPAVDEPATWNDAVAIPNGMFAVSAGGDTHKFKIFTILRTANDGLRYKRVVSWYNLDSDDWETFAFLTESGRLKVWRRFQAQSNERWQNYARQLLNMLKRANITGANLSFAGFRPVSGDDTDPLGVRWTYAVTSFNCRYCPERLESHQTALGHNACANQRRQQPDTVGLGSVTTSISQAHHVYPATPRPTPTPRVTGASREVFTRSMVTGTWEQ